jgi:chemotaxis protein CheD
MMLPLEAPAPFGVVSEGVRVLMPGDVACAPRGTRLETLLGSCVAIVMTDPRRTVGAMCHIVHRRPASHCGDHPGASAEGAVEILYRMIREHGLNPAMCHDWVFGGGNMFPTLVDGPHVGQLNGEWVLERLARDGVRVIGTDLGGATYRRLAWTIGPGLPEVEAVPA